MVHILFFFSSTSSFIAFTVTSAVFHFILFVCFFFFISFIRFAVRLLKLVTELPSRFSFEHRDSIMYKIMQKEQLLHIVYCRKETRPSLSPAHSSLSFRRKNLDDPRRPPRDETNRRCTNPLLISNIPFSLGPREKRKVAGKSHLSSSIRSSRCQVQM